jgi:class 3 adenylate cyclase
VKLLPETDAERERAARTYARVAVVGGLLLLALGAPEAWTRMSGRPWDGRMDWWAARFWWEGGDPFSAASLRRIGLDVLGHPPTSAFYALPLARFDLSLMGRLLGAVVIAAMAAQLFGLARELRLPRPAATALLLGGCLLVTPFMLYHLGVAQISALIAACYFLAWYWLRRDRDVPAGIALGLACTLKLFPGALVLFLALTRRWRGVGAAAAVWLGVAALMTARFGFASWGEYIAGEPRMVNWWIGHVSNVTLQGIVLRLLHPYCVADSFADPTATAIAVAGSLALLVALVWISRRAMRSSESIDLPFALFALWSMFANTFYWEHYDVILLLPLAIAAAALWRARLTGLSRTWTLVGAAALVGAVAACLVPPNRARVLVYASRKQPALHLIAHLNEIAIALPMPLLMGVLAGLLIWFGRRGLRGLERLGFTRAPWLIVAALALTVAGCGGEASRVRPLAGQWPCRIELVDGSVREIERFTMPMSLFRDPRGGRPRAVECSMRLEGAWLAGLERPAVMLGNLGEQRGFRLTASFDGVELPESRHRNLISPLPLPPWTHPARDPLLRVRYQTTERLAYLGEPLFWMVGDYQAVWKRYLWRTVPDVAMSILLAMLAVGATVAAVAFRRSREDAVEFSLLGAFAASFLIARVNDNLLLGVATNDWLLPIFWLRGPTGILILGFFQELLRRHHRLRLARWMQVLYASIGIALVLRVAALFGVATRWFNWTNLPAFAMLPGLVWIVVRGARDPRPGSRALLVGVLVLLATGTARLLGFIGLPRLPDLTTAGLYALVIGATTAVLQSAAARRRRLARAELLGRFVPAPLVRRVLDGVPMPRQERLRLTIFFSDLRGFTRMSDRTEPEVLATVLTEYLTAMAEVAEKHGGTIDKFIGDAVMVFFGAPDKTSDEAGALACVRMALEMQRAMPALNARWPKLGLEEPLSVRMGINTGFATVGEFGSLQRSDYTAIGSAVNLAQRLEANCPAGKILVSRSTCELVQQAVDCQPMESIVPKGYDRPIAVWLVDPDAADQARAVTAPR